MPRHTKYPFGAAHFTGYYIKTESHEYQFFILGFSLDSVYPLPHPLPHNLISQHAGRHGGIQGIDLPFHRDRRNHIAFFPDQTADAVSLIADYQTDGAAVQGGGADLRDSL